ncbi:MULTISPECIES: type I-E CRISPR-associated protein Cas6/Cse3/CasE [Streptomyces]|uniref:type I-E CRISPR-associated protein Cas6/Cse3/CasE n=1 Tax=Streptomyces TaxID=1883 RepID=UPI000B81844D|nr:MULTISPECIES: type I-E CRISPR-associated protein Cas6/Cse3/CasE [Streptomyces]
MLPRARRRHLTHHTSRRKLTRPPKASENCGTVTDPVAAARALVEGLGRGRAYGCGLLHIPALHGQS